VDVEARGGAYYARLLNGCGIPLLVAVHTRSARDAEHALETAVARGLYAHYGANCVVGGPVKKGVKFRHDGSTEDDVDAG
jgi:hypothetical protein